MLKFIFKIIAGLLVGLMIGAMAASSGASTVMILLMMLWGLGMVFAIRSHLQWLDNALGSATKLSIISFLSFGSGILGFLLLVVVLTFNLTLGWIYGIYLFIRDLITLCEGRTL